MKSTQAEEDLDLDEGACIFGAGVLLEQVKDLAGKVEGVSAGDEDIEFIHKARVATRRLRATLPLFHNCLSSKKTRRWVKSISKVTHKLGEARDSDVQIEVLETVRKKVTERQMRPGINRLLLRLHQRREKLQKPVSKAMDKLIKSGMLEEMHDQLDALANQADQVYLYTPVLYQHGFQSIHQRLEDLLSYEDIVSSAENVEELHQMRIAAKWLRYTMETFSPLYANELKPFLQAVRKIQDLLGEVHDSDVWAGFLPQFIEEERQRTFEYFGYDSPMRRIEPGIRYFEQNRQAKRNETYQEFLTSWKQWQDEGLWDALRKTIQVPFLQPQDIYPPLRQAAEGQDNGQES